MEVERQLRADVRWPTGVKGEPVTVVLVRDAAGEWRDEVLLATGRDVSAAEMVSGFGRCWGIEEAFQQVVQTFNSGTGSGVRRKPPSSRRPTACCCPTSCRWSRTK